MREVSLLLNLIEKKVSKLSGEYFECYMKYANVLHRLDEIKQLLNKDKVSKKEILEIIDREA